MQIYKSPNEDILFQLKAFDYEGKLQSIESFEDFDLDMSMTMLEELSRFCEGELLPLNETGDRQGLQFDAETSTVTLPDGFREAYQTTARTALRACPTARTTAARALRSPCPSWPAKSSSPPTSPSRCARASPRASSTPWKPMAPMS